LQKTGIIGEHINTQQLLDDVIKYLTATQDGKLLIRSYGANDSSTAEAIFSRYSHILVLPVLAKLYAITICVYINGLSGVSVKLNSSGPSLKTLNLMLQQTSRYQLMQLSNVENQLLIPAVVNVRQVNGDNHEAMDTEAELQHDEHAETRDKFQHIVEIHENTISCDTILINDIPLSFDENQRRVLICEALHCWGLLWDDSFSTSNNSMCFISSCTRFGAVQIQLKKTYMCAIGSGTTASTTVYPIMLIYKQGESDIQPADRLPMKRIARRVYGQFINSKIKINSVVGTLATIRGISSQSSLAMLHAKYVEEHVLSKIGTILDLNRYALFLRFHVLHADTRQRRKKERYEDGSSSGDLLECELYL
jgi:hypothetical protein